MGSRLGDFSNKGMNGIFDSISSSVLTSAVLRNATITTPTTVKTPEPTPITFSPIIEKTNYLDFSSGSLFFNKASSLVETATNVPKQSTIKVEAPTSEAQTKSNKTLPIIAGVGLLAYLGLK